MFVRKKKNRSGTISVVVVSKSHGQFKEVKSFGVAQTESDADNLYQTALHWLKTHGGQQALDFENDKGLELEETMRVISNMDAVLLNGTQLLLDRIYDDIGFNGIPDDILLHLVIARICQPASKLATIEYLKSYYDEDIELNNIYRYMDKLYNTQQELIQQISVEHTRKILGGKIGLMFYDVTLSTSNQQRQMSCENRDSQRMGKRQNHKSYLAYWLVKEATRCRIHCSMVANMKVIL